MSEVNVTSQSPTDTTQFSYLANQDFISSTGNLKCEFFIAENVLLTRLIGALMDQEDLECFDKIKAILHEFFPDCTSCYVIVDASSMRTISMEHRRDFYLRYAQRTTSRMVLVFGLNKAMTALLALGRLYGAHDPAWMQVVPDLATALRMIAQDQASELEAADQGPRLTSHERTVLTTMTQMLIENRFDLELPELPPNDPFSDLFVAMSSLQDEFRKMQQRYDENRQALSAANIELDRQVRQQSELLLKSEENYRLVVETATDGILIINDGIIRYANPHMLSMLRCTEDEVVGQSVEQFTNPGARAALIEWTQRHSAGEQVPTRYESAVYPKYGKPVIVEIHATQMTMDGEKSVLAFVRDMTHRKLAEEAQRAAREMSETLREIGELLGATLKPEEVVDRMVELGRRIIPYENCVVYFVNSQGAITLRKVYNFSEWGELTADNIDPLSGLGESQTINAIMESRQPLIINNIDQYVGWVREEKREMVGSLLGIPVLLRDGVRGIISITTRKKNFYDRNHAKNAQLFGHQVSLALDNAFLYEQAEKRITELSILNELSQMSTGQVDIYEMLQLIYRLINHTFNARDFCVRKYLPETNEFETMLFIKDGQKQPPERAPMGEGLLRMVVEGRKPVLIRNMIEYRKLMVSLNHDTSEEPMTSWMGVPLILNDEIYGVMTTKTTEEDKLFRHDDLSLFHTVGSHLAVTIEKVQLDEQMQQYQSFLEKTVTERTAELEKVLATLEQRVENRTEELTALYTIASLINRMTSLPATLQQSLRAVLSLMGAAAGAIHLTENENIKDLSYTVPALSPEIKKAIEQVPRMPNVWDDVVKEGNPVIINNLTAELEPCDCLDTLKALGYQSFIALPIHGQNQILGMLGLYSTKAGAFDQDDVGLLSAVTDQIGMAVENVALRAANERNAIEQERQRLARDLHDSVSQMLYSQVLYSNAAKKGLANEGAASIAPYLDQLEETARQALREMRLMIFELRPNILAEEGLSGAIRSRIESVEQRTGMVASLNYNVDIELSAKIETELYYITMEALNNALKHSMAHHVHVNIGARDENITLEIADDGKGFVPDTVKSGMGLVSMRERTRRIGGTLDIYSTAESGTRIFVRVKLPEDENG